MSPQTDPLAGISPALRPLYQQEVDKGKIGQDEHGTWRWYWTTPEGDKILTSGVVVDPFTGKLARYKRVTSFNKVVHDRAALDAWTLREIVASVVKHPDLIAEARVAAGADDDQERKKKLNKVLKKVRERSNMGAAATLGSAIHAATDAARQGKSIPDLGEFAPDVEAYLKAIRPFMIVDSEQFGVSDQYRICGSWDCTFGIRGSGRPAFRVDTKTGRIDLNYLDEVAQQLGSYAVMQPYDQRTGERGDSGELDMTRALVVKVWPGQAKTDLIWVPLEKAMRTLLPLSQRIFDARQGQTHGYMFDLSQEVGAVGVIDHADPIEQAISSLAGDPEQVKAGLLAIWQANQATWGTRAEHYKALGDQRLADAARDVVVQAGLAAPAAA
jgi:hypothetical protein